MLIDGLAVNDIDKTIVSYESFWSKYRGNLRVFLVSLSITTIKKFIKLQARSPTLPTKKWTCSWKVAVSTLSAGM